MPDFKILGNASPAASSLGVMTQGLGFALRDVEASVSGGAVTVLTEIDIVGESLLTFTPSALDTPLQISFGDAQNTDQFTLAADGTVTCLVTDEYNISLRVLTGRLSPSGVTHSFFRATRNGVSMGDSVYQQMSDQNTEFTLQYNTIRVFNAGDVIRAEFVRDSSGANDGIIRPSPVPAVSGWAQTPSTQLVISRNVAVAT